MIDLEIYGGADRTQGVFPNVSAINSSGDNNDGTPFMKSMVNDIWGFYQACMYESGLTPSGNNETSIESQILKALKNICGGPGEIVIFAGNHELLYSSGKRLLPLEGTMHLVSDYLDLMEAVFNPSENEVTQGFYRSTDPAGLNRDVNGDYLHVPDYRGYFIRGYDPMCIINPDVKAIHAKQDDKIKQHSHYIQSPLLSSGFYGKSFNGESTGSDKVLHFQNSINDRAVASETPSLQTIPEETRPKNRNALICVRY